MEINRVNSVQRRFVREDAITIINIDSRINNKDNPVVEFFSAGSYEVKFLGIEEGGQYDAWSRWDFVYGCDEKGENCTTGWLNGYHITSGEFTASVPSNGIFATPEQALAKAQNTSFTLTSSCNVSFFISDDLLPDNRGGVSLAVRKLYQPSSTSLFGNLVFVALLIGSVLLTWFILDP
ncbi:MULTISPECIES: hypothetical protein [unclassified Coleofasciculus]|uniref:hypothetical protein n=1 Tax=unclassified Coleofasciculus TaxID=2692782 RepID=UPI0018819006|nr:MULTISPECIES: hypothetical protein [unclassified Coleofasciculus]MBE9125086.1 hypothetical protein [Coleofasciculus sp. LEGE 07081]MBE9150089.1 hypothetical protein [Coleofasciculus sp. LEGE 07092]